MLCVFYQVFFFFLREEVYSSLSKEDVCTGTILRGDWYHMTQSTVNLYNLFFWGGGCSSFMFVDPPVIFYNTLDLA